jgi:nicotinamidase-related amidase
MSMSSTQNHAVGRAVTSAQPYAWPYHGLLAPSRCVLVACVDPAWRMDGPQSDASDALLRLLAAALQEAGGLVVAAGSMPMRRPVGVGATQLRSAWPNHLSADLEIAAAGTSGFYGSGLDALLRRGDFRDLMIAGWGLEGPVHSTMRAANDRGYECLLVPDACTSLAPELAFNACEMVRFSGGIFGAFADTADVIRTLAGSDASGPPTAKERSAV